MTFRKLLVETCALLAITLLVAGSCWAIQGGPEKKAVQPAETLPPGYINFQDATKLEGLVWVDARDRKLWQRNGHPGSVFLTDHPSEDWDALIAEAFETLATAQSVVIYCATEGCGSSEPVARKIRELGVLPEDQVYVLAGGWKSLQ